MLEVEVLSGRGVLTAVRGLLDVGGAPWGGLFGGAVPIEETLE
jgi:hypothetical protein